MKINKELFYALKDEYMIAFLKEDKCTIQLNLINSINITDEILDKKLLKAYNRILKYYGVNND